MGMSRLMGMLSVVPAAMLLAVSFFVLLALRRPESKGLKAFGYAVLAFLWIAASFILLNGFSCGRPSMMHKMKKMMGCPMQGEMKGMGMPKAIEREQAPPK